MLALKFQLSKQIELELSVSFHIFGKLENKIVFKKFLENKNEIYVKIRRSNLHFDLFIFIIINILSIIL